MPNDYDLPALDDLVDAIAARLAGRLALGPLGEPSPLLPAGLAPPGPKLREPDLATLTGARLRISGVEFTQSTQHHGSADPTYGPDNSVPLVAYKAMVARVYPYAQRGIFGDDTLTGRRVTGELTLSVGDRVVYRTGPTRSLGARLGPSAAKIDRTLWDFEITTFTGSGPGSAVMDTRLLTINCSLNFAVPAYYCKRGRLLASVRVWPVDEGPSSGHTATATEYLQLIDVPAPKVCLVRVNWTDAAGAVQAPTDTAMLDTLRLAQRMLPFPYFETTILGLEEDSSAAFAMPVKNGGCNVAWLDLITELNFTQLFTVLFQLGDIVYGMVSRAAIPPGPGDINSGCGKQTGGGFVGFEFESTFAHELGHLYQAKHVAVPGDPDNEPSYPKYARRRAIGEVGIDTGTTPPTLYDATDAVDIMAYTKAGEAQWISPFTYQKILDNRALHMSAKIDPSRLRPLLVLDLRVHRMVDGISRIDVRKAARIDAPGHLPAQESTFSPVSIDFLDSDGLILATHHCTWTPAHGGGDCGCGGPAVPPEREPWLDVQEAVEWPGDAVAGIAFHRGGRPFRTIEVGEPPEVSIERPERTEDRLAVRVRADHPREEVSVVVLFSNDDGVTWQPVSFDPSDGQVTVAVDHLPGGSRCLFRAVGTAELRSTTADTEAFDLPLNPRRLYLDVPSSDCTVPPGSVEVSAMVDTRGLGAPAPVEIRWSSDLDGELGAGYSLGAELNAGQHTVTVTAPDGIGGTLTERAAIVVGGRPRSTMSG